MFVVSARADLDTALIELVEQGSTWPCAGEGERWYEGGPVKLAEVEKECVGCSVRELCGLVADEEGQRFGVWGGTDRTAEHVRLRARGVA